MAMQTADPSHASSAQTVGDAFVKKYYHLLHNFPEQVQKLFQDSSVLSWPGPNGKMTSVTIMKGINNTILLSEFKDYEVEIAIVDAQDTCNEEGVIVLVTGCLTGKDNLRRKFAQTFFLTKKNDMYYVSQSHVIVVREFISKKISSRENYQALVMENVPKVLLVKKLEISLSLRRIAHEEFLETKFF